MIKVEADLFEKLKNCDKLFNDDDVSIITECIVIGYIHGYMNELTPNIILYCICQYYGNISISNILNNDLEWMTFIHMIDKELGKSIGLTKILDSKIDGLSVKSFHNKCDNKGPTICIFRNEYQYIFGGYTKVSWSMSAQYFKDANAFIFGIKPKLFVSHIKPDNTQYAIFCSKKYGPVFGYFGDIWLQDGYVSNGKYCNFTSQLWSYNCYQNLTTFDQTSKRIAFKVDSYEVYVLE